jgi:hypothetical protein
LLNTEASQSTTRKTATLDKEKSADRNATISGSSAGAPAPISRAEAEGFVAHFGARLATDFPEASA